MSPLVNIIAFFFQLPLHSEYCTEKKAIYYCTKQYLWLSYREGAAGKPLWASKGGPALCCHAQGAAVVAGPGVAAGTPYMRSSGLGGAVNDGAGYQVQVRLLE